MKQSYFAKNYASVRFPIKRGGKLGLRNSQRGALHAVAAHFSLSNHAAIVVLPTGAGKTAVLMLVPYLLQATRALIITPSKFVRRQIAQDFDTLSSLKRVAAFGDEVAAPKIYENKKGLRSIEEWEALSDFDAVISTPNSASPAYKGIPEPPMNLFDLVLIDEAHHSPARTWNAVISSFPDAKCVLFTATPFRSDRKQIKGAFCKNRLRARNRA